MVGQLMQVVDDHLGVGDKFRDHLGIQLVVANQLMIVRVDVELLVGLHEVLSV